VGDPGDPDVASDLIASLEAGAEFVDRGRFTFALAQAHEKLAKFRLAEPQTFVLLLVEVAHLLPGCTGISFTFKRSGTQVVLAGADLRGDELRSLFDALFLDLDELDSEAGRRGYARRQLASALITALELPQRGRIELCSTIAGERALRLRFDPGVEPALIEAPSSAKVSSLSLVFADRGSHAGARRGLLRSFARRASIPVSVDRRRIDEGFVPLDLVDGVEIREPSGRRVVCGGWSEGRADAAAELVFVANGVVVESQLMPQWRSGFCAVVEAGDLSRDLSQTKLVRDAAYQQRIALAQSVHDRIESSPPLIYDGPGESAEVRGVVVATTIYLGLVAVACVVAISFIDVLWDAASMLFEGVGFFAARRAIYLGGILLGIVGPFAMPAYVRARHWSAVARGRPAVGTVLSATRTAEHDPWVTMRLSVEMQDRRRGTFRRLGTTSITAQVGPTDLSLLQERRRVYLRVHPNNDQRIMLARKSRR